jgi:hypothetical protein
MATTGAWLDIGIGPLTNFQWFLRFTNDNQALLANSFYAQLLGSGKRESIRANSEILPFAMWPSPRDCTVLGHIANGDILILVSAGNLQGNVYVLAQEVPGPANHLANKDYLTWIKWVLRSSLMDLRGEEWYRPWYY